MTKKFLLAITFLILILLVNKAALASTYEEEHRDILLDKKVKATSQQYWHENLSSQTITFTSENETEFKIWIKNNGNRELKNIKIVDNLPHYLTLTTEVGSYNKDNRQIEWKVDTLSVNEEKEFYFRARINQANDLPQGQLFCLINKAEARAESGQSDSDTAQFCIDTRILGVAILPEAGNNTLIATIFATSIIAIGFLTRKIGRGELFD